MIKISFYVNQTKNKVIKCDNVSFLFCQTTAKQITKIFMKKVNAIFAYDVIGMEIINGKDVTDKYLLKNVTIIKTGLNYSISATSIAKPMKKALQDNEFPRLQKWKGDYNFYDKKSGLGLSLLEVTKMSNAESQLKAAYILEEISKD